MGQIDKAAHAARDARRPAYRGRQSYGQDSEFINLELSVEEVEQMRQWREDESIVSDVWAGLLEEGYRTNVKYDDYSSAFAVFIIPGDGSDNVGFILTGRGGTPYRAVCEGLFKHAVILHGEWGNAQPRRRRQDDPDF